ncbi:MAG: RsmE family RNA methyltransferase, partial [Actinomycetes bacterium]
MSPPVFLVEAARLAGDAAAVGATVRLEGPEGRHAVRVRRLAVGEQVDLADGAGTRAHCVVARAASDVLELRVTGREVEPEPVPRVVVVQALAKGDRAERAVEAMTEVGVDAVVPWAASRSVVRWRDDRAERALARWRAVARE